MVGDIERTSDEKAVFKAAREKASLHALKEKRTAPPA